MADLQASTLESVNLSLTRRPETAATGCGRVTGSLNAVGSDGRTYIGTVSDSSPNVTGPVRFVVNVQDASNGRGIPFISLFTGAFADSATFRGTFELGVPGVPRPSRLVEFRKLSQ